MSIKIPLPERVWVAEFVACDSGHFGFTSWTCDRVIREAIEVLGGRVEDPASGTVPIDSYAGFAVFDDEEIAIMFKLKYL